MEDWTFFVVAYMYTLKCLCHILPLLLNPFLTIPMSFSHCLASLSLQMFSAVNLAGGGRKSIHLLH